MASLAAVGPASASPTSVDAESRAHFQDGRALYEAGRYREAMARFEAGYARSRRPLFLINIGQCHRQLFEPAAARASYEAFLATAPLDDPARPEVEELIREIDRAQPRPVAPIVTPAVVAPAIVAAPPRPSFVRRHFWIFPVSAVVLAGVGVGIYFGVRGASSVTCADASIGCLQAAR